MPTMFRSCYVALRLLFEPTAPSVLWRLMGANALAVAGGLLAGLAPLALKSLVDAATSKPAGPSLIEAVALAGGAYFACMGLGRLLAEFRPALASAAEQRLFAQLRTRFFRHALELPLSNHLARQPGALQQTLQQAISGYQIVMFSLVNGILPIAVETLTVIFILRSLGQPNLTAAFAATVVAYLAAIAWSMRGLGPAAQEVASAQTATTRQFADGLINIEPIKCFGTERRVEEDFDRAARHLERSWKGLHRRRLRTGMHITAIYVAATAFSLALAVDALGGGRITTGGFVLVALYLSQIMRPLEMLAVACRDVFQALAFIQPLQVHFDQPTERSQDALERNGGGAQLARKAPAIRFEDVSVAFKGTGPVLNSLSLEIPAGQAIAIVGASGSGKSSLGRLLLRLCEPQGGQIFLDDHPIRDLTITQLRAMIAVVPQDIVLFNTTIAANIAIGKEDACLEEIMKAARLARLHDTVCALPGGYDTMVGERGLTLSGGERQRIAIARAILRDPLIYVFDEATSMLDGRTEAAILDKLKEIAIGRTTITIAHRLSTVQHMDDIVVLAEGAVAERGRHAQLIAHGGLYAAMWRSQVHHMGCRFK